MTLTVILSFCLIVASPKPLTLNKCTKDLHRGLETEKQLEENIAGGLPEMGVDNEFLYNIKNTGMKRNNRQTGLHQTEKLLQSKGNFPECIAPCTLLLGV